MHTPKLFEITDNAIIEYCAHKNELQLSKGSAFPVSTHIPIDLYRGFEGKTLSLKGYRVKTSDGKFSFIMKGQLNPIAIGFGC